MVEEDALSVATHKYGQLPKSNTEGKNQVLLKKGVADWSQCQLPVVGVMMH